MLRLLFRLLFLPFRLAAGAGRHVFRVGLAAGRLPLRVTSGVGRLFGLRAVVTLIAGLAIGLLFAPGPGRELRARLQALIARWRATSDADLVDRVVFELEHAPRTWHLPQPEVSAVAGQVALVGTVADDSAATSWAGSPPPSRGCRASTTWSSWPTGAETDGALILR